MQIHLRPLGAAQRQPAGGESSPTTVEASSTGRLISTEEDVYEEVEKATGDLRPDAAKNASEKDPGHEGTKKESWKDAVSVWGNKARVKRALSQLQKSKSLEGRFAAAKALGELGGVPALLVAVKDEDRVVRGEAAKALGEFGDAAAVPALLVAMKDKDSWVCLKAAEAVTRLRDTQLPQDF